jgi:hypothetical protein
MLDQGKHRRIGNASFGIGDVGASQADVSDEAVSIHASLAQVVDYLGCQPRFDFMGLRHADRRLSSNWRQGSRI